MSTSTTTIARVVHNNTVKYFIETTLIDMARENYRPVQINHLPMPNSNMTSVSMSFVKSDEI